MGFSLVHPIVSSIRVPSGPPKDNIYDMGTGFPFEAVLQAALQGQLLNLPQSGLYHSSIRPKKETEAAPTDAISFIKLISRAI